jgi:hypothetical protein
MRVLRKKPLPFRSASVKGRGISYRSAVGKEPNPHTDPERVEGAAGLHDNVVVGLGAAH